MNSHLENLHVYLREIAPDVRTSLSLLSGMVSPDSHVLDLGCGSGALGEHLSRTRNCTCDGVTISPEEAALARPHYRDVHVADLETVSVPQLFPGRTYDAIICADVLEHLRQPERVLDQCLPLLRPEGRLLVSVPNAGYAGLVMELMHGEFRYRPEGLLDRTHLRFFTRKSLTRFLTNNGWQIERMEVVQRHLWDSEFAITPDSLPPAVARYLLAQPDAMAYQWVATLRPASPAERDSAPTIPSPRGTESLNQAVFTAQLYLGDAGDYDEARKRTATGTIGVPRQTLQFELPAAPYNAPRLRLDLADRPGFLHLHGIRLRDGTGQTRWSWHANDLGEAAPLAKQPQQQISWAPALATAPDTALVLLTGDDPWIELPIAPDTLAQCLQGPLSVLEVELGWPMSADYLALASSTGALQRQAAHTERALAQAQHEYRLAQVELARLQPLAHEQVHLQNHNAQLAQALQQLQTHVGGLERSRAVRVARNVSRVKKKLTSLFAISERKPRHEPPTHQPTGGLLEPPAAPPPVAPAPELLSAPELELPGTPVAHGAPLAHTVDIVIPVYQGLEDTRRCLTSVLDSTNQCEARVIVINDASPNPALTEWLRAQAAQEPRITLLENPENLGFVRTVNRGMALATEHDVLLLNSDTEVAGDWLDRLRHAAYSHIDIGTVTPLSNNATICSYPRVCENNPLPAGYNTAAMDSLCARTHPARTIDIPTAVGFCMYIRRDCLAQTGEFDAAHFGTGYGEENDFCMRAATHGWRHVMALDTFVRHVGGVSFGTAKSPREAAAQATLRQLHPGYEAAVQAYLAHDPALPYREALDIARLQQGPYPVILAVLHGIGGGTLRHVHELSSHLNSRARFLTVMPLADHRVRVQWDDPREAFSRDYHWIDQADELVALLREVGVSHIHYHHLLGVHPGLMLLAERLEVTYDFTVHDYYTACPQVAMVDTTHSYCGEWGTDQCAACLQGRPAPTGESIEEWRLRHRLFLNGARNVLAPSRDAAQRALRYFPSARVRHAPHLDLDPAAPLPVPQMRRLDPGANLRVFVVGALSQIKGANILEAASLEAAALDAPIEFHLLGYPNVPFKQQPYASLTVHGPYNDSDLPRLLKRLKPDLVWFPARWPETYSYTLSACIEAGLPILAPNIGAFPERLAGRAWTWLYPWNTLPGNCLAMLLNLRADHFVAGMAPRPASSTPIPLQDDALPAWTYDSAYLDGITRPASAM